MCQQTFCSLPLCTLWEFYVAIENWPIENGDLVMFNYQRVYPVAMIHSCRVHDAIISKVIAFLV